MATINPPKPGLIISASLLALLMLVSTAACNTTNGRVSGGINAGTESPLLAPGMPFNPASTIYNLDPAGTEARFLIGEILLGEPKTVIGKTNQVRGQIALDLDNLSLAAVGPIQVDARSLLTDDSFRNRAIETRILLSRIFQTITFNPTAVSGLPDTAPIGESIDFQITGDLTITEYTQPVVFEVTAVAVSDTRIEGSATATIQRADFNLFVPAATGVAGVEEEVILQLDFTAEAPQ